MPAASIADRAPRRPDSGLRPAGALEEQVLVTILDGMNGKTVRIRRSSRQALGAYTPLLSADMAYKIVRGGISSRLLESLARYLGLGKGDVAEYVDMDRTTVARKVKSDEALPTHAAESMLRIVELSEMAKETFETTDEAWQWLRRPHPMLEGETPLECAKSAYGGQRVKDMLLAIKYGGVV